MSASSEGSSRRMKARRTAEAAPTDARSSGSRKRAWREARHRGRVWRWPTSVAPGTRRSAGRRHDPAGNGRGTLHVAPYRHLRRCRCRGPRRCWCPGSGLRRRPAAGTETQHGPLHRSRHGPCGLTELHHRRHRLLRRQECESAGMAGRLVAGEEGTHHQGNDSRRSRPLHALGCTRGALQLPCHGLTHRCRHLSARPVAHVAVLATAEDGHTTLDTKAAGFAV